mgnify:CR=1 FL=1
MRSLMAAQAGRPLLWIIDSAPLFLGVFASFGGRQVDLLHGKNIQLKERYEQQRNTVTVPQTSDSSAERPDDDEPSDP